MNLPGCAKCKMWNKNDVKNRYPDDIHSQVLQGEVYISGPRLRLKNVYTLDKR